MKKIPFEQQQKKERQHCYDEQVETRGGVLSFCIMLRAAFVSV